MTDLEKELTEDEIKILRRVVEREKAVGLIWKWLLSFLAAAVPLASLYALYKSFGGQP